MDDLNLQESIPESFGKDLTDFNLSLSMTGKKMPVFDQPKEDVLIETFGKVDRKIESKPVEKKLEKSIDEKQRLHDFENEISSLLANMAQQTE